METVPYRNYPVVMETIVFGIGYLLVVGLAWFAAADSRPETGDSHTEKRIRWFPR